ncbi:MAG: type VII secretion protein EccE [Streptosporangiales bacterium]|nr:type VII secretion protein EccE [Streptosporangiales bacterium]
MSATQVPAPAARVGSRSGGQRRQVRRRPSVRGPAVPTLRRGRRRLFGLGAGQLVACELAVAAVLLSYVTFTPAVVLTGPLCLGILVLTLVRRRRRFLYEWMGVRMAYRRRRKSVHRYRAEDPRLELLREISPTLEIQEVTNRSGNQLGAVGDGQAWCALLELQPPEPGGIVDPGDGPQIPLQLLVDSLEMRDIRLASIQALTHTVPVFAGGGDVPFVRSYQQLGNGSPSPRRTTWVVLRLDPALCSEAVALRGGGDIGARRALLTSASRLAVGLEAAGVPVRMLDAHDALTALMACTGANPWQRQVRGMRTAEHWKTWTCDGVENTTFWVRRWPRPPRSSGRDLFAPLAAASGVTSTMSLVFTGNAAGEISFRGMIRVAGSSADQLTAWMTKLADSVGADLERLDGQHTPGVLATLPLGGGA